MEHYGPVMLAGRYEVLKKIGAGGMANVYKARDTKLDRYVAIKICAKNISQKRNFWSVSAQKRGLWRYCPTLILWVCMMWAQKMGCPFW